VDQDLQSQDLTQTSMKDKHNLIYLPLRDFLSLYFLFIAEAYNGIGTCVVK